MSRRSRPFLPACPATAASALLSWSAAVLLAACPSPPPAVHATLSVGATTVDFGLVVPGAAASRTLTLTADGTAPVTFAGPTLTGTRDDAFTLDALPATLAPGASATLTLTFHGDRAEGTDTASLAITSDAENLPLARIALTGRTAAATCTDGTRDGDETAVDCGGSCPGCAAGTACGAATDCVAGLACVDQRCGACTSASECRSGEICRDGSCTGCTADADCAAGSTCVAGACRACPGATGPIDTKTDVSNCGACGHVCPAPVNATAICRAGSCGRTPCVAGAFDLDGATTFGCEATCSNGTCRGPGGEIAIDNTPIPERALGLRDVASGSSFGDAVQTSTRFTNIAVLGEPTPPPAGGAAELRSTRFILRGGVNASQH